MGSPTVESKEGLKNQTKPNKTNKKPQDYGSRPNERPLNGQSWTNLNNNNNKNSMKYSRRYKINIC